MKHPISTLVVLVALALLLTSCDAAQPAESALAPAPTRTPAKATGTPAPAQTPAPAKLSASTPAQQEYTYTSQVLTTSYSGALNAANQLMLGMLRLAGTANTITSEQAKALLPMLQSLQGQALTSDAERSTVLARAEAQFDPGAVERDCQYASHTRRLADLVA